MTSAALRSIRSTSSINPADPTRSITRNLFAIALLVFATLLLTSFALTSPAWADTLDPTFDPTTDPNYVATDPASPFASGTGTETDPYIISNKSQLEAFRDSVNKGFNFYKGAYIKLTANIDLGGSDWTPIGNATRSGSGLTGTSTPFQGHFDGGNNTISGLAITTTPGADAAIGLFGAVMGGTVENLTIADAKIDVPTSKMAAIAVGMLCADGTVSNVSTSGSVNAKAGSGGVVARMTLIGTISNCTNRATVTTPTGTGNTGGIVGAAYYTTPDGKMVIENCTNLADITGTNDVGGIVGLNCAFVSNCINSGAITGSSYALGGIAGECKNYGGIDDCVNSGDVTYTGSGTSSYGAGGITGWVRYDGAAPAYAVSASIAVTNNTNSGSVKGSSDAGGIVGVLYNAGTITGNQNDAQTLAATNFAGGVVANIQNMEKPGGDVGSTMLVENNVSTTPLASIDATYKGIYAYNNVGDAATISDNGSAWIAANGAQRYVSLAQAFADAKDGDELVMIDDAVDQKTVTKSNAGTMTLNLDGHAIELAPDNDIEVTSGTLVVEGEGNIYVEGDTGPAVSADVYPFAVKPASGDSADALLEGGAYDVSVADLAAPGFAELVKDQPTNSAQYVVLPADQAKSLAKAQLTAGGHTIYYANAANAEAAAAKDPTAVLEVYDQSTPADPDHTNTATLPGDGNTAAAGGAASTDATNAAANSATDTANTPAQRADEHVAGDTGSGIPQSGDVVPGYMLMGVAVGAMAALALALISVRKLRRS